MKVALPVNEKSMETSVCQSFGRTPYFLIYDVESKESIFIDNSGNASQGGAGIKAAQAIVDNGATALLTPRCGENAADVLNAAGVKIYRSKSESIQESILSYVKEELPVLADIHPGFHNHEVK